MTLKKQLLISLLLKFQSSIRKEKPWHLLTYFLPQGFHANTFAVLHANKVIVIPSTASIGEGLAGIVSWIKMIASHVSRA